PLRRDEAQRLREIRLLEDLVLLKRHAPGAEDSRGLGVEARARRSRVAGEHEVHQEAVLGELDRGLDHLRKVLPPVALQRRGHDLQGAGNTHRLAAGGSGREPLVGAVRIGEERGIGARRRLFPALDGEGAALALREVHHHEAVAAAASMALPPLRSILAPASAASGCDTATTPPRKPGPGGTASPEPSCAAHAGANPGTAKLSASSNLRMSAPRSQPAVGPPPKIV